MLLPLCGDLFHKQIEAMLTVIQVTIGKMNTVIGYLLNKLSNSYLFKVIMSAPVTSVSTGNKINSNNENLKIQWFNHGCKP